MEQLACMAWALPVGIVAAIWIVGTWRIKDY
jgi:hypothetical protein